MDKATKALRRSSVRIKSLSSGHSDLKMIISDLKDCRYHAKTFVSGQYTTWEDMLKWATKEKNCVFKDCFQYFFQLSTLWTEVQREFLGGLKKFEHQYQVILEGEQHIDKSRAHLISCEQKQSKLLKEMKQDNSDQMRRKLEEANALVKAAQSEVTGRVSEHEAVKMIMVKEGLLNLSESFLELAEKALMIFEAHRNIALTLPDAQNKNIQDIRYTGAERAKKCLHKTTEDIMLYKKPSQRIGAPPSSSSSPNTAPPPYTTSPLPSHSPLFHYRTDSPPYHRDIGFSHHGNFSSVPQPSVTPSPQHLPSTSYSTEPPVDSSQQPPHYANYSSVSPSSVHYDLPPRENYENLIGAIGGVNLNENTM